MSQLLTLVVYPDQLLRKISEEVDIENDDRWLNCQHLMRCMVDTMRRVGGLGLSAIQVAVPWRVVLVESPDSNNPLYMVNPEILQASEDTCIMEEGCLSFPGIFAGIERPSSVLVGYYNYDREYVRLEVETLVARCVQHEIDHLNGKVFADYLKPVARDVVTRKMKKFKKKLKAENERLMYAAAVEQQRRLSNTATGGDSSENYAEVQSSATSSSVDDFNDGDSPSSDSTIFPDEGKSVIPTTD